MTLSKKTSVEALSQLFDSITQTQEREVTKRIQESSILYPKFKEALTNIRYAHSMHGSERAGMILTGLTGVGKSRAVDTYIAAYYASRPELETDQLTELPILKVRLSGRPTYNGLLQQILMAADHVKLSGNSTRLFGRVKKLVKEQNVQMLVIDEFQHLLSEQARVSTRDVLNLLKTLMDDCKFSCLLTGLPEGLKTFVQHDEIRQRFAKNRFELCPFSVADKASVSELRDYLKAYDRRLEQEGIKSIALSSEFMLPRVYLATLGLPRAISELISSTLDRTDISSPLTKNNWAQGYEAIFLDNNLGETFNPFVAKDEQVKHHLEAL